MIHIHTERCGDAVHLCNRLHLGGHARQIHRVRIGHGECLAAFLDRTVELLELANVGDVQLGRTADVIVLPQDLAVHKGIELHIVRTAVLIQVLVKNKIDARGFADVLAVGDLDNGIHLRLNADAGRSELAGILQGIQDLLTDVPQLAQCLEADHQRTLLCRLADIPRHGSARSNRTDLQRGTAVPEVDRQELACASVEENRTVGAHRVPVGCVPTRTRGTVARCAVAPGRITIVAVLTIVVRHSDVSPFDVQLLVLMLFALSICFRPLHIGNILHLRVPGVGTFCPRTRVQCC